LRDGSSPVTPMRLWLLAWAGVLDGRLHGVDAKMRGMRVQSFTKSKPATLKIQVCVN